MKIRNVILVEDDADDQELFIEFCQDRKDMMLLPIAGNGLELIMYLESLQNESDLPHLIVLDQNMPKMNGKQTLEFLKSSVKFSRIPVVIYSTYTDSNLIKECTQLGAHMVAVKPIDFDGYQKMMDVFLQVVQNEKV